MRRFGLLIAGSVMVLLAGCAGTGTTAGSAAPAAAESSGAVPESSTASSAVTPETTSRATSPPRPGTTEVAAPPATTAPTVEPSPSAEPGTVITTSGSQFGDILFDGTGQAIYLFDKETTSKPDCYDDCAAAWPPVLTPGAPVAGGSVTASSLGTTTRTDGTSQVTYFDHPLYYYAHEGPNDVTCHNVDEFGGLWLVVTPAGDAAAH